MRWLIGGLLVLSFSGVVLAQGVSQSWSLGGYGSILHPGIGHTPTTPPGGITGPYFGNGFAAGRGLGAPIAASHPQHRRTVIVPYPVYYGGYAYGYDPSLGYAPPQGYVDPNAGANANTAPSVVINQNYIPPQANPVVRDYAPPADNDQDQQQSGLKLYQTPPTHPYADAQNAASARRAGNGDEPTLYLIAFKDHTIVQALGYWMEGSTLHYVSAEHTLNQASMDLIDRDLSQRLNDERGVEFKLPQVH